MKKLFPAFLLSLVLAASSALAQAEIPLRIAVADMDAVFRALPETVAAQAALDRGVEEIKTQMQELIDEGRAIEAEVSELSAASRNDLLTPEARTAKRLEYEDKLLEDRAHKAKVSHLYDSRMKQLQERIVRDKETIVADLLARAAFFARRAGYDLLLDRSGMTANNIPITVFVDPRLDVTEPLIEWLKAHPGETIAAADAEAADGGDGDAEPASETPSTQD
jgi:Skp family chaperone for outer membrane proteins